MRPFSPSRLRRPSLNDDDQLSLPFLVEDEASALTAVVDHIAKVDQAVGSKATHPRRKTASQRVHSGEKSSPLDRKPAMKTEKRKPPAAVEVPAETKLLVSRKAAAVIVSLSLRKIDGLLASKQLPFRKIGTRTLIPLAALQRFARMDHPERRAG